MFSYLSVNGQLTIPNMSVVKDSSSSSTPMNLITDLLTATLCDADQKKKALQTKNDDIYIFHGLLVDISLK